MQWESQKDGRIPANVAAKDGEEADYPQKRLLRVAGLLEEQSASKFWNEAPRTLGSRLRRVLFLMHQDGKYSPLQACPDRAMRNSGDKGRSRSLVRKARKAVEYLWSR